MSVSTSDYEPLHSDGRLLRLVPIKRDWRQWLLPFVAGTAWLALVAVLILFQHIRYGSEVDPQEHTVCMFRRLTDVPCATCRGTRAGMALLRARPLEALAANPLVTIALFYVAWWLFSRIVLARRLEFAGPRLSMPLKIVLVVVFFFANWAYVLWMGG